MTAINYLIRVSLTLLLLGVFSVQEAMAFEINLPKDSAQKLASSWKFINTSEAAEEESAPDYSNRLANVATAPVIVTTEESEEVIKPVVNAPVKKTVKKTASKVIPTSGQPLVLEGEASYYSRKGCLGCSPNLTMANGQTLDDNALTMAIGADKSYLVGHLAKVTNLSTGQSVTVTITDTGGFYQAKYGHRVADLTIATKQAIGMYGGVGQVRVEVY